MRKKRFIILTVIIVCILFVAANRNRIIKIWESFSTVQYYVTQYGDVSGGQAMFYTIENTRGNLIVIDGGYDVNADQVRDVIMEKGGHVNEWIITHPHPDHVGAFNVIFSDPQGIEIDAIHTIELDYDSYKEIAQEWDQFSVYETFLEVTKTADNVFYLHTGDELEICGLKCKVFSAYEKGETEQLTSDLANCGSLVFKLTNREESFLFLADIKSDMDDNIIQHYGDELGSTYVQMSHHGNWGAGEELYRLVKPQAAFFDAPDWLMYPSDPESTYTTPDNIALMEGMGSVIYSFSTVPNQIELK